MRYNIYMRTTLDLEDDLLEVARELARRQKTTIGGVVSAMMRKALEPTTQLRMRNGVPLIVPKPGARKPSLALVNRLRDE